MTTADPSLPRSLGAPAPSGATERFGAAVRSLRTRGVAGRADRALLLVGGLLLPLGVLVVVLGWLGASHNVLVFEQVPYVISGGLLGLALTIVGGFVYFNYWQAVGVRESRSQHRELLAALDRIESVMARGAGAGLPATPTVPAAGAVPGGAGPAGVRAPAAPTLVATTSGSMMHRPDCPVVAGRDNLRAVSPGQEGLEACRICDPLGAVADQR